MPEEITTGRRSVAFSASRLLRVNAWFGLLANVVLTALAVSQVIDGSRFLPMWWFIVVSAPLQVVHYAWQITLVHQPILQFTHAVVTIRTIRQRVPVVVGLDEIVCLRWQDSFDLRLCLRQGDEMVVPMRQIARRDRPRVHELLRSIVGGTRSIAQPARRRSGGVVVADAFARESRASLVDWLGLLIGCGPATFSIANWPLRGGFFGRERSPAL